MTVKLESLQQTERRRASFSGEIVAIWKSKEL